MLKRKRRGYRLFLFMLYSTRLFFVRRKLQPNKISPVVVADRALSRRLFSGVYVAAVETDPAGFHIGNEQLILFQKIGESAESVSVYLFNFCNHMEGCSDFCKSLFLCFVAKALVFYIMLLIFVVLRHTQQL